MHTTVGFVLYQALRFHAVQAAKSGIGPFASRILNLTQSIDQKSENLQWEKCRYITNIDNTFSDTAQYFH